MEWLETNLPWLVTILSILSVLGLQIAPIKFNPLTLLGKIIGFIFKPIRKWFLSELEEKVLIGQELDIEYKEQVIRLDKLEERHITDMTHMNDKIDNLINLTLEVKIDRLFDNIRIIKKYFVECDEQLIDKKYLTREQYKQVFKYEQDYEACRSKLREFPDDLLDKENIPNGEIKPTLSKIHDAYANNKIK